MQRACNEWLADWLERNPAEAKVIITKASQAARARIAAAQARKLARRKSLLERSRASSRTRTASSP